MDYEKEIGDIREDVAGLRADVNNLIGWQKAQNGSVKEIRKDVGKLMYWIMGSVFAIGLNLLGVVFILLRG